MYIRSFPDGRQGGNRIKEDRARLRPREARATHCRPREVLDGEGRQGLGRRDEGSPQAGLQTSKVYYYFFFFFLHSVLGAASLGFGISRSRNPVKMDLDIKNLTLLLIFQIYFFCTLEGMGLKEIAISLGHWQQLCCMTLALHGLKRCGGRGRRRLQAHD